MCYYRLGMWKGIKWLAAVTGVCLKLEAEVLMCVCVSLCVCVCVCVCVKRDGQRDSVASPPSAVCHPNHGMINRCDLPFTDH